MADAETLGDAARGCYADQIASHVGKARDLVVADFSTTGPTERAASEIVLMDSFQAYFEYVMSMGCGIPSITLEGTEADWRSIRRRAAMLSEYGLEWWTNSLLPVLDEIANTSAGRVDKQFWRSFFRYQSGSGPSELTGWIHVLFPYIKHFEGMTEHLAENEFLPTWEAALRRAEARKGWRIDRVEGAGLGAIPGSLASAPVRAIDVRDGSVSPLRFVGGLFGVTQEATTGALAPEFGWAVVHEPEVADGSC